MLKKLFINGKAVPVPVPLLDLEQALRWVEATFNGADGAITRIMMDREEVRADDGAAGSRGNFADCKLSAETRLELQIDSPLDLTIQLLDTLRNLATVLETTVKHVAVTCWQAPPMGGPDNLTDFMEDVGLMVDLLDHLDELQASSPDSVQSLRQLQIPIKKIYQALKLAQSNSDWKSCAKILLNSLEPQVRDVILEAHRSQSLLFATKAQMSSHHPLP